MPDRRAGCKPAGIRAGPIADRGADKQKTDPGSPRDRSTKSNLKNVSSLRLNEQADEAGRALGMAVELGLELRQREPGRQLLRIEIGRDDHEGVVVGRAGRRAGTGIESDALGALAADELVAVLADFAFRERGHVRRFLLATFFGIMVPSLKVAEESENGSAALATPPMPHAASTRPLAATSVPK
jgi:hypothetical protein